MCPDSLLTNLSIQIMSCGDPITLIYTNHILSHHLHLHHVNITNSNSPFQLCATMILYNLQISKRKPPQIVMKPSYHHHRSRKLKNTMNHNHTCNTKKPEPTPSQITNQNPQITSPRNPKSTM